MPYRRFSTFLGQALSNAVRSLLKPAAKPVAHLGRNTTYPGDYQGKPPISYEPHPGTLADPGEVVWTWVPFEEDYHRGKDRPVLIIGRDGEWLLGLMLTSKDHDRDAAQEAQAGRHWIDVGAGAWDAQHRNSEIRVDRIIRVHPKQIRRLSEKFPKSLFGKVAAAVQQYT